MRSRFSMFLALKIFSGAVLLISLVFNMLLLTAAGKNLPLPPSLIANSLLLIGVLGMLVSNVLAAQKLELEKMKTDLALLSNSKKTG